MTPRANSKVMGIGRATLSIALDPALRIGSWLMRCGVNMYRSSNVVVQRSSWDLRSGSRNLLSLERFFML